MNKNIFLIFILGLLITSFTSAVGDIGTVKQYNCIDLYNYCPSCSYVNLTAIKYPNVTTEIINSEMTNNGYNYNYSFCHTMDIGEYSYTTCGDKDGEETCEVITFEVTPNGSTNTLGFYILLIALSIGIVILGYYVQDAWIVALGSFAMVLLGLYILYFGIDGMKDTVYTWGIGIIILALGSYFGIKATIEKIEG